MFTTRWLVLCLFLVPKLYADETWVNQEVMPKRGSPKLVRTNPSTGEVEVVGHFNFHPAPVREEKGEWVKLQVNEKSGWVKKDEIVRINEGIQYFTDRIAANDDVVEAYTSRSWLWHMKREPDNAIKDEDEALKLKPSAYCYNIRGTAWYEKKRV